MGFVRDVEPFDKSGEDGYLKWWSLLTSWKGLYSLYMEKEIVVALYTVMERGDIRTYVVEESIEQFKQMNYVEIGSFNAGSQEEAKLIFDSEYPDVRHLQNDVGTSYSAGRYVATLCLIFAVILFLVGVFGVIVSFESFEIQIILISGASVFSGLSFMLVSQLAKATFDNADTNAKILKQLKRKA